MNPFKTLLFTFLFSLPVMAQITDLNSGQEYPYKTPQEYEIGPIRVVGADNYDHQAIKLMIIFPFSHLNWIFLGRSTASTKKVSAALHRFKTQFFRCH